MEMPHFHIFVKFFAGYSPIYKSSRTVQVKQNVTNLSVGVSIESCMTVLIDAARTPPSFTRCQTKVDFCKKRGHSIKRGANLV